MEADDVLTKEASESPLVGVTERGAASRAGQSVVLGNTWLREEAEGTSR